MIDQATLNAYRTDGAVALRNIIAPEWVARLREGVAENMAQPGPFAKRYTPEGQPGLFFGDYCNWQRIDAYRAFFFDSPLKHTAAALMGSPKVNLYHEHVLVKEPGTKEKTPWHHDQPYYPVDGEDIVSFWIPLDPVEQRTCPEYIAGSHRWGRWFTPARFADLKSHAAARFRRASRVRMRALCCAAASCRRHRPSVMGRCRARGCYLGGGVGEISTVQMLI